MRFTPDKMKSPYQKLLINEYLTQIFGAKKYGKTIWFSGSPFSRGRSLVSSSGEIRAYSNYGIVVSKQDPLDSWPGEMIKTEEASELAKQFKIIIPKEFDACLHDNGFDDFRPFNGYGFKQLCTLVLRSDRHKSKDELMNSEQIIYKLDTDKGIWCRLYYKTFTNHIYYFPGSGREETRRSIICPQLYRIEEHKQLCAPRVCFLESADAVVADICRYTKNRFMVYAGNLGVTEYNFCEQIQMAEKLIAI